MLPAGAASSSLGQRRRRRVQSPPGRGAGPSCAAGGSDNAWSQGQDWQGRDEKWWQGALLDALRDDLVVSLLAGTVNVATANRGGTSLEGRREAWQAKAEKRRPV